jgi:hypothetical protein
MPPLDTVLDPYFGLFVAGDTSGRVPSLVRAASVPASIPDPQTGRPLRVATVDGPTRAICPACATSAEGGFISFVGDLRLAYACPSCVQLVWLQGA